MPYRIGYARVSTTDQQADSQADSLTAAGADKVYVDYASGSSMARTEWSRLRGALRPGDTLMVTRLDRLGRSTKDLLEIAAWLESEGVELVATEQPVDTRSPEGRVFFSILAAFAQFERDLIVARTQEGLAAARARGRHGGRPKRLDARKAASVANRYRAGDTVSDIAADFNVSRPTIYRVIAAQSATNSPE